MDFVSMQNLKKWKGRGLHIKKPLSFRDPYICVIAVAVVMIADKRYGFGIFLEEKVFVC